MSNVNRMSRDQIESLADRAAEDGEHAVVAAAQVLLRAGSSDEDTRHARRVMAKYLAEVQS